MVVALKELLCSTHAAYVRFCVALALEEEICEG